MAALCLFQILRHKKSNFYFKICQHKDEYEYVLGRSVFVCSYRGSTKILQTFLFTLFVSHGNTVFK